ncbi:glycerol-3-phosphate 1-O-acyltransferase PlsY [Desulfovibrio ferrophilus]|uniref:Glycerol-3-phosphate acyltransferase n=1 Tax=Desulfovibrio ferrophilus TaxID=241368 RepID=A0A2Z6B1E3_9BACT|nr:glycerol-3-phosphate 1-O-acyltransferase PlsY [Desulfovibrio ferrophilus]BBD09339.1 membrane protein [Desulfovibrio ferrophilus]
MASLAWLAMAYLLGAVPFGLVVGKIFCGIDPRTAGSKNTGATNVARLCGFKYGVLALVLDLAKGFIPTAIALTFSDSSLFLSLTGLAAILGHCYSVFLYGKGGKAVATTVGVFLALAPISAIIAAALCIAVIAKSGYVSLGSLTLVTALPILMLVTGNITYCLMALVVMALVFWRHRENIERLARGEEKSFLKNKYTDG